MSYPICRDLQLQDQFFEGVLCRAAHDREPLDGRRVPNRPPRKSSRATYFSVLGVGAGVGTECWAVTTIDARRESGGGAFLRLLEDATRRRSGCGGPQGAGKPTPDDGHRRGRSGVPGHRRWRSSIALDSRRDVGAGHSRLQRSVGSPDALDAGAGPVEAGRYAAQAQAGLQPWFKAMLDEDTRRAGFPRITAERRRRFLASTLELTPAPQGHSGLRRRLSQPLWVLFAATAVLLGLACLNVAGLFLARGSARDREIGTRLALGASRGRIGRQLLPTACCLRWRADCSGWRLLRLPCGLLIAFLPARRRARTPCNRPSTRACCYSRSW